MSKINSYNNTFSYSDIKNCIYGVIEFERAGEHNFYCNNFIRNIRDVSLKTYNHTFDGDYWNRPRSRPKWILGWTKIWIMQPIPPHFSGWAIPFPRFMFDRNPAQEPYDIPVV